jgi:hypothetical protein
MKADKGRLGGVASHFVICSLDEKCDKTLDNHIKRDNSMTPKHVGKVFCDV